MNLLALRDRIRTKAIANSLTYTEIETLFDVNELLNQTMPCLAWKYSGETNDFSEVGTEMSLNIYLLTNFPDSVKTETADYQRDYIITQQDLLRTYFYTWLQAMPFESGSDFLEVLTTDEIPIAERLSINAFLTMEFRVNISIKRDFCVEPEEIAPTVDEVKVYFNSVLKYTQACNVDLQLTLKNQDGDDITAAFTGYDIVVTQPVAADARVSNSDDSYDVNVVSGGDLELPDINVSNSDDSYSVTYPSVQDVELPDETINIVDEDGNPLDSITFPVYTDPNIDISSYCPPPKGLLPLKTGQTTSYASNDDGATQRGRLTDFNTIPYLNPYGDNFRFTDELGGQTFTNNIVIDWSTWDGGSSVNGYCFNLYSSQTGTQSWDDWMLNSPYTCSTFADWYLVNFQEMASLMNMDETYGMDGYPFNILSASNNRMYTSTTYSVNTNQALFKQHNTNYISNATKTSPFRAMLVRTFTISGTTLS
jgi:hypothetical protein